MYSLVNKYVRLIVSNIPKTHVTDYERLFTHLSRAKSPEYQRWYRKFWAMNASQLGSEFYSKYFERLSATVEHNLSINEICSDLYECSGRRDGRKSLQFSFATKLLHMAKPTLPIYDSQVSDFYFFDAPDRDKTFGQRFEKINKFYEFLIEEHRRVLAGGILESAIDQFRDKLKPQKFTDEKVIDSLIWKTTDLLRKGALTQGQVVYS